MVRTVLEKPSVTISIKLHLPITEGATTVYTLESLLSRCGAMPTITPQFLEYPRVDEALYGTPWTVQSAGYLRNGLTLFPVYAHPHLLNTSQARHSMCQ